MSTRKNTKATPAVQEKDFSYIADKPTTELHEVFAAYVTQATGVELSAKQAQAMLATHGYFQRSKHNKERATYHGLDQTIVEKRSEHMTLAHKEARELQEKAKKVEEESAAKKANAKPAPRKAAPRKPAAKKAVAAK